MAGRGIMQIHVYSEQLARPSPYIHVGYISARGMEEDLGSFILLLIGACAFILVVLLKMGKG